MNTSTLIDDLKAVRKLISTPGNWTKHHSAQDTYNTPCSALSPDAVCWCLEGAAYAVTGIEGWTGLVYTALESAIRDAGFDGMPAFNDHPNTTHARVMKFLDGVISDREQAS